MFWGFILIIAVAVTGSALLFFRYHSFYKQSLNQHLQKVEVLVSLLESNLTEDKVKNRLVRFKEMLVGTNSAITFKEDLAPEFKRLIGIAIPRDLEGHLENITNGKDPHAEEKLYNSLFVLAIRVESIVAVQQKDDRIREKRELKTQAQSISA